MSTEHEEVLAHAFDELGRACQVVAAALRLTGDKKNLLRDDSGIEFPAPFAKPMPKARKQKPLAVVDAEAQSEGLTKTQRKILVALAQLARPLSSAQLAFWLGVSKGSGTIGQGLADLRRDGLINGPGSAVTINGAGLEALGEYAALPAGQALFLFWCQKLGGGAERVLRYLRPLHHPVSSADIADALGVSRGSGTVGQALADLRRMQLVTGPGSAVQLSPDFRRALEPTIGVFDMSSGRSVRVDTKGNAR